MDHSVASGTRLLELRRLSWDGEAHRRSTWRPIWSPSPNGCARYAQLAPVFTGLYESLLPIFTAPHDLVPVLPLRDDEPDAP